MADLRTVLDMDFADVSLADEIAAVKRDLAMREHVYPQWIQRGKMKQAEADRELRRMRAVLKRLLIAEQTGSLL